MNIVVLSFHRLGGSGIIAHEIAHEVSKAYGHHIHFVGLEPPYRMDEICEECEHQISFHPVVLKPYVVFDFQPYVMALASQLSEIITRYDIDVIHSHYAIPHALAGLLARQISGRKNVKTVVTLHGTDITIVGADASMQPITRYSILESDHVIAVSEYLRAETKRLIGTGDKAIEVIPNFINAEKIPSGRKDARDYVKRGQTKIIMHSSNLREIKAPVDTVEIYARMLEMDRKTGGHADLDKSELAIMGTGPGQQDMEMHARQRGISDRIRFYGERHDIYERLNEATLFLLPSKGESFGLAALEAMACGVPVVARHIGGVVDVIDDNETGILFRDNDLDAAARAAVNLIGDGDLYARMSKQAAYAARHKFPMVEVLAAYERIYRHDSSLARSMASSPQKTL